MMPAKHTYAVIALMLAVLASALPAHGQSDAQFTQYYAIPAYYNPAAVGRTDYLSINGGARLQWVGIDHAPKSFVLQADMPVKVFNKRFGVGVDVFQESIGLFSNLDINAMLAYKFRKFGGEFTVGVSAGAYDQSFRGSETYIPDGDDFHESGDDAIPKQDLHGTALDLGAGIWYEHRLFWAGISATHLTSPTVTLNSKEGGAADEANIYEFQAGRTLYFMAGGNIPVKNTLFEVMPSVLVKSDFTFTTAEITARARYRRMFSAAVGYRWNDAVTISLAAEIKNFYVGYAFDYPTSALARASSGSHEIFAGYRLKLNLGEKNRNRHKSIRIM